MPRELSTESWTDKSILVSLIRDTIAETLMNRYNSDSGDSGHDDGGDHEDHNEHHKA